MTSETALKLWLLSVFALNMILDLAKTNSDVVKTNTNIKAKKQTKRKQYKMFALSINDRSHS